VLSPTVPVILVDVDKDGEAMDFPPKTIVDKKEVVDKLRPHHRLRMDAHILFPEAYVTCPHNRFHSGTYPELPTRGILVQIILS